MPGGFGTLDEAFEIITLMQCGKLDTFPVVAMGGEFWGKLREFVKGTMIAEETISPEDLDLLHPAKTVEEAVSYIESAGG